MISRAVRSPWWVHATTAVVAAFGAFWLTLSLDLHDRPFLLPMIAVLIMALRGGLLSGSLCAVVTMALANYHIAPPVGAFQVPTLRETYELAVFGFTAAIISALAARGRRAQQTMEATVASIGDGVIVTDRAGRVTFLNRVAERLTGWTIAEANGFPISSVFNAIHEDTRAPAANPVERALREGLIVGLAHHALLVCRDGSERPIADSAAPIQDEQGKTIGAVLVFRDASPQRQIEASLERQAEERLRLLESERAARGDAERANRLKDDFLATLSHELRTPLNAVLGWSHMLQKRTLSDGQQRKALEAIHRNALAQGRLVDDVLDLSRIVTGRLALTAEIVDLGEVVRATVDSITPAVLGKRQTLHLDLSPASEITGDPHRLRQVAWNLLSNATKFTPEGGAITVRVARAGSRVELTVSDSGQGIDPAFLPFVFDRFRQGDSSSTRHHGGLGLGLALVRHLVEAHGGTVSAASPGANRGTTVTVTLPALTAESRARGEATAETPAETPGSRRA